MEKELTRQDSNLPQVSTFKVDNLTPDELYYLQLGNENYTIKQYSELKLKDAQSGLEGGQLARLHIGASLEKVYELIGLKKENYPTGELAGRIGKYIHDTFPYISPIELLKAVEMGLQGKYPAVRKDGSSIFEHYQIMDLPFINEFMQAYVKFRYDKKEILNQKIEKAKLPVREQVREILIKDDETVKAMIIEAFNRFKINRDDKVNWLRQAWFDWLVDLDIVPYNQLGLNAKYKLLRARRFDLTPEQAKQEVRKIAIYEAFENLIDKKDPFEIFERVTYVSPISMRILYDTKD